MDKITDFIKELRTRISSPLFSSFLIAWLVFNWRVPIALVFYKMDEVSKDGYRSYFDLIQCVVNTNRGIVYPLLSAIGYTMFYPWIRSLIQILHAWANKVGTDLSLRVAKTGKISVERYIRLRETYEKLTYTIENVLGKETEFLEKNETLLKEKIEIQSERDNWKNNYEEARKRSDINAYNGEWQITYMKDGVQQDKKAVFGSGNISITNKNGQAEIIFKIKSIGYSQTSGEYIILFQNLLSGPSDFFQSFLLRNPENRSFYTVELNTIIQEFRKL